MKRVSGLIIAFLLGALVVSAQESGNRNYGSQRRKPQINSGILTGTSNGKEVYFIEATVALNSKADAYTAVFGLAQVGANAAESNSKLTLKSLL